MSYSQYFGNVDDRGKAARYQVEGRNTAERSISLSTLEPDGYLALAFVHNMNAEVTEAARQLQRLMM